MPNKIERISSVTSGISLTPDATTSPRLPYGATAGGMIFVSAVNGATKITWHVMPSAKDDAVPLYIDDAPAETLIAAGRAYQVPEACFAAPYLRMVLDAGSAEIAFSVKG